jgi:hypothetical protein
LLYNRFFEHVNWRVKGDAFAACPERRCQLTSDKNQLARADAVLFNTRGLPQPSDLPPHIPSQVSRKFEELNLKKIT